MERELWVWSNNEDWGKQNRNTLISGLMLQISTLNSHPSVKSINLSSESSITFVRFNLSLSSYLRCYLYICMNQQCIMSSLKQCVLLCGAFACNHCNICYTISWVRLFCWYQVSTRGPILNSNNCWASNTNVSSNNKQINKQSINTKLQLQLIKLTEKAMKVKLLLKTFACKIFHDTFFTRF